MGEADCQAEVFAFVEILGCLVWLIASAFSGLPGPVVLGDGLV